MTHDEMIAVIQAHKEGKEIQFKNSRGAWLRASTPNWDFDMYEYRIKPEPREFWIDLATGCITKIENMKVRIGDERHIHVREVLDEEG